MSNIGIVGQGFVGTSVARKMREVAVLHAYDLAKGWSLWTSGSMSVDSVTDPDPRWAEKMIRRTDGIVFVCLPTPMKPDGSVDISIVSEALRQLNQAAGMAGKSVKVLVKSTVPPGTVRYFNEYLENIKVVFNPEFLREATATEDYASQKHVILGGEFNPRIHSLFRLAFPAAEIHWTDSTTAEMVKYLGNCYLAVKVSFANEMAQISEAVGVDWGQLVHLAVRNDPRLGESHWQVPGPMLADDGSGRKLKGFGGSCFPKDLNGMMSFAWAHKIDPKVMHAAWEKNLEVRPERDWENLEGRAVCESLQK